MQLRIALLLTTLAIPATGGALVACSSKNGGGFEDVPDASVTDATAADAKALGDSGRAPDGANDAGASDAPAGDGGGAAGHCSPVRGACDVVLQDCPAANGAPQQCVVTPNGNTFTTACAPIDSSQHLGKGHACCPSAASNQCNAGLECIGDQTLSCDGGALPGRCSPHCCGGDAGDDSICGASDPEGIAGHCDLEVSAASGDPLFTACSYDVVCKPFGVRPCPANETCVVKDTSGSAGCYPIFNPDGGRGANEGEPCAAANSCADGLVCLGSGSAGTCFMLCYVNSGTPNFDAGGLAGGPFTGGCSSGKSCRGNVIGPDGGSIFPPWISICQ